MNTILVAGATGMLGSAICARLAAKGTAVRALVRPTANESKVENLKHLGAELMQGDLRDPASLNIACQGVNSVISTVSAIPLSWAADNTDQTVDTQGQMNLIDAARAAHVSGFTYTSYSGGIQGDDPLTTAKRKVERYLQHSGLTYTVLRPSYFMEVWLSPAVGFDAINAKAQVYGSGHNKISWISLEDVAQFAVESLDNPAARNAVIELGGPDALSPLEVIHIFEEKSKKSFDVQYVPEEALRAQEAAAPDAFQKSFAALMLTYAKGDPIDMEATLKAFPVQLTSVRDYAARVPRG